MSSNKEHKEESPASSNELRMQERSQSDSQAQAEEQHADQHDGSAMVDAYQYHEYYDERKGEDVDVDSQAMADGLPHAAAGEYDEDEEDDQAADSTEETAGQSLAPAASSTSLSDFLSALVPGPASEPRLPPALLALQAQLPALLAVVMSRYRRLQWNVDAHTMTLQRVSCSWALEEYAEALERFRAACKKLKMPVACASRTLAASLEAAQEGSAKMLLHLRCDLHHWWKLRPLLHHLLTTPLRDTLAEAAVPKDEKGRAVVPLFGRISYLAYKVTNPQLPMLALTVLEQFQGNVALAAPCCRTLLLACMTTKYASEARATVVALIGRDGTGVTNLRLTSHAALDSIARRLAAEAGGAAAVSALELESFIPAPSVENMQPSVRQGRKRNRDAPAIPADASPKERERIERRLARQKKRRRERDPKDVENAMAALARGQRLPAGVLAPTPLNTALPSFMPLSTGVPAACDAHTPLAPSATSEASFAVLPPAPLSSAGFSAPGLAASFSSQVAELSQMQQANAGAAAASQSAPSDFLSLFPPLSLSAASYASMPHIPDAILVSFAAGLGAYGGATADFPPLGASMLTPAAAVPAAAGDSASSVAADAAAPAPASAPAAVTVATAVSSDAALSEKLTRLSAQLSRQFDAAAESTSSDDDDDDDDADDDQQADEHELAEAETEASTAAAEAAAAQAAADEKERQFRVWAADQERQVREAFAEPMEMPEWVQPAAAAGGKPAAPSAASSTSSSAAGDVADKHKPAS